MKNMLAPTTANHLVQDGILEWVVMHSLMSDFGSQFMSELFHELCELFQIKTLHTCPYYPNSNAVIERLNRVAKASLTCLINSGQIDWDKHLKYICFANPTSIVEGTSLTPFFFKPWKGCFISRPMLS